MKKFNTLWIGVLSTLFGTFSFADFKGEVLKPSCVQRCFLHDGFYLGVDAGYDVYQVQDDIRTDLFSGDFTLSANGLVGGAFIGFGKYLPHFYQTYFGIEAFGNGSASASRYILNNGTANYLTDVKGKNSFGLSILPGIRLTPATLFYIRLGYNGSKMDVTETITTDGLVTTDVEKNPIVHGFSYGLGIESAFFDDFSLRLEYTYTNYNNFKTDLETKISPENNEWMLGLIYHLYL